MTRHRILVIALLGAGAAGAATAPLAAGRASDSAEQVLIERERAWSAAYLRHDVTAVGKILDEDYLGIDGRGVITHRADELSEAAPPAKDAPPPVFQILDEQLSDFQVRLFDKVAVVNALNTVKASVRGQPRTLQYRRTTVWRRSGPTWRCVSFHASEVRPSKP